MIGILIAVGVASAFIGATVLFYFSIQPLTPRRWVAASVSMFAIVWVFHFVAMQAINAKVELVEPASIDEVLSDPLLVTQRQLLETLQIQNTMLHTQQAMLRRLSMLEHRFVLDDGLSPLESDYVADAVIELHPEPVTEESIRQLNETCTDRARAALDVPTHEIEACEMERNPPTMVMDIDAITDELSVKP